MLDDSKRFVPLPQEKILFTSPPRTTLALQTPNSYPGKEPLSLQSSGGTAFLTNQRLVYLPTTPTPQLQSFSAPILNLQDTHVTAPFFGPNVWTGILQPVTGGGIPAHHSYVEIKMTFKDGGAFDFHANFERVKETLTQAVEEARESGRITRQSQGIDLSAVHLEQLPAYEEIGGYTPAPPTHVAQEAPIAPTPLRQAPPSTNGLVDSGERVAAPLSNQDPVSGDSFQPPSDPPPGYEEAQQSSVVDNLEESVRRSKQ